MLSALEMPISTAEVFVLLEHRFGNLSNATLKLDHITYLNVLAFIPMTLNK
jgi:hypothetical protein